MSEQSGPLPQRIGDSERDQAADYLRDHMAMGRLDQAEFDERLTRALTARTQADLDPLFTDLPGPRPGQAVAPAQTFQPPPWQATPSQSLARPAPARVPGTVQPNNNWAIVSGVAWTAALIFCFATGWNFWWVILIPVFLPWWSGQGKKHSHHRR